MINLNVSNISLCYEKKPSACDAVIVLKNGMVLWGHGIGIKSKTFGEFCFNTSITGYQEILTDPSYSGQIINFTFPHIGNVGINEEDIESSEILATGAVFSDMPTLDSSWRSNSSLHAWFEKNNITAISGIDTRMLTKKLRDCGAIDGVICYFDEQVDLKSLFAELNEFKEMAGKNLAIEAASKEEYDWNQGYWDVKTSYNTVEKSSKTVVVVDFGVKKNILRSLSNMNVNVHVVPCTVSLEELKKMKFDGLLLSNGPGDPAAVSGEIFDIIDYYIGVDMPIFGICLGHQILGIALGCKTKKMHFGHRGANHPIKNIGKGFVEITSQNHGFVIDKDNMPEDVEVTHESLFDGTVAGIKLKDKNVFSVQYHPESSPGPHDSRYLFEEFYKMI